MPGGKKGGGTTGPASSLASASSSAKQGDQSGLTQRAIKKVPSETRLNALPGSVGGSPSLSETDLAKAMRKGESSVVLYVVLWALNCYFTFVMNLHIYVFNESKYSMGAMYFNFFFPLSWVIDEVSCLAPAGLIHAGLRCFKLALWVNLSFIFVVYILGQYSVIQAAVFLFPVAVETTFTYWARRNRALPGASGVIADAMVGVGRVFIVAFECAHLCCVSVLLLNRHDKIYVEPVSTAATIASCFLTTATLVGTRELRRRSLEAAHKSRWLGRWEHVTLDRVPAGLPMWDIVEAPYHSGDMVMHGDSIYVAVEKHNCAEPGSFIHPILHSILRDPSLSLVCIPLVQLAHLSVLSVLVVAFEYSFWTYLALIVPTFLVTLYTLGLHKSRVFISEDVPEGKKNQ